MQSLLKERFDVFALVLNVVLKCHRGKAGILSFVGHSQDVRQFLGITIIQGRHCITQAGFNRYTISILDDDLFVDFFHKTETELK